ncbi:MAG: hypothetical protein O2923_14785 [Verrucomicrobia bacterium]|nr:hypothetical protein [Verrucomicrobiota bacterium]MDA1087006.1 hypothetical protein [Verrucomicrobiota bacterium]
MREPKRVFAILFVNAVIFLVGLVLLELIFGGWLDARKLNRLNLVRDSVRRHDVSGLYEASDPIVNYSRDKYGLRGSSSSPGSIDILTVGGSTTDQRFIRDGETWQDVLQNRFEQAGRNIVVANAGVDGQSTVGHIMNFKWWFPEIPGLAPEYILFYAGLNEFHVELNDRYDRLFIVDQGFSLNRTIRENSALVTWIRILRGARKARRTKMTHRAVAFGDLEWSREPFQSDYDFMDPVLQAYADRLITLIELSEALGAKPVFVSQPSRRYRVTPHGVEGCDEGAVFAGRAVNGVDFYHIKNRLDRITEATSRQSGALFVDLAMHGDWTDADFYDCSHMTPRGAMKVGDHLYEALRHLVIGDEPGESSGH